MRYYLYILCFSCLIYMGRTFFVPWVAHRLTNPHSQQWLSIKHTTFSHQVATRHTPLHLSQSSSPDNDGMTLEMIQQYAKLCNLTIAATHTGPFLKIEAFTTSGEKVGYLTAFIRPFNLLHLDTIQIPSRRTTLGFQRPAVRASPGGLGASFVLGAYALVWGFSAGCREAQLLAVRDSPGMNRALVRLYQRYGFVVVREVGDTLRDVPDRLVWGAVGTLMQLRIASFVQSYAPLLRRALGS